MTEDLVVDFAAGDAEFSSWVDAGEPRLPYCAHCERFFFYPRPRCPRCHNRGVGFRSAGPFEIRTFTWVMRPQTPSFDGEVPILMVLGESDGASVIAEGRGWTRDNPPSIGDLARFATHHRPDRAVVVFEPQRET